MSLLEEQLAKIVEEKVSEKLTIQDCFEQKRYAPCTVPNCHSFTQIHAHSKLTVICVERSFEC